MTRSRNERGASESVQWALLAPVMLAVLFGAIQVGLMWHGRNVAVNAAAAAVEAESAYGSRPGDAQRAAATIAHAGGLLDHRVEVSGDATAVRARVVGRIPVLVDLGLGQVDEIASAPRERLR
ncbi:TadE family protein [Mariniluteicoccus flavus]